MHARPYAHVCEHRHSSVHLGMGIGEYKEVYVPAWYRLAPYHHSPLIFIYLAED